jgi:hypothetical protein
MMQHKIVARFLDGRVLKGVTFNFRPERRSFHLQKDESGEQVEVNVDELKSVFFVKDLTGNKDYTDRRNVERRGYGRRLEVKFVDGESIVGYTQGYSPDRPGFFMAPADPDSNNDRIFVVRESTAAVNLL